MALHPRTLIAVAAWLAAGGAAAASEPASPPAGAVVVEVDPHSATARADLQPGDVVLTWERLASPPANPSPARGEIRDPFQWQALVWEQAPRGTVVLTGLRAGRPMSWEVPPGEWDLEVRPNLAPAAAERFERGTALVRASRVGEGVAVWVALARRAAAAGDWQSASWLWLRSGRACFRAQQWSEAETMFGNAEWAARQVREPLPWVVASVARGDCWRGQLKLASALASYHPALPVLAAAQGESLIVTEILGHMAESLRESVPAPLTEATRLVERGLGLAEKLAPGSLAVSDAEFCLGRLAYWQVDHPRAVVRWERALAIGQRLAPDGALTSRALYYLSDAAQCRGDLDSARKYGTEALRISRAREPVSVRTALCLWALSAIHLKLEELEQAEQLARETLAVLDQLPHHAGMRSGAHDVLGLVAGRRHDHVTALRHHRQALELEIEYRGEGSLETTSVLVHVADDLAALGDEAGAKALYERALTKMRALSPDLDDIRTLLDQIGLLESHAGRFDRALELFRQSLAFVDSHGMVEALKVGALLGTAEALLEQGEAARAEASAREAVRLAGRYRPGTQTEAEALGLLGRACRLGGRRDEALELARRAVDALDAQMGKLGGSETERAGFRAAFAGLYRQYLELLLEAGRAEEAFHVLERYRARGFLELLATRDLRFAEADAAQLDAAWTRLAREVDQAQGELAGLGARADDATVERAHSRLEELHAERERLLQRTRDVSPRLASLRRPEPLDVTGASSALDPGTLLVSYSVGEDDSTLFALSRGEGLTASPLGVRRVELEREVAAFRRAITVGHAAADWQPHLVAAARRLYDLLLGPADSRVQGCRRVLILPDGPLHTLPFAALVRADRDEVGGADEAFLVESRPLYTAMSATVLAELTRSRPMALSIREGGVVVFGDPVYPSPEPSSESGGDSGPRGVADLALRLDPLPSTRAEAEAIHAVFAQQAQLFIGEAATEEQAKAVGPGARILHFACHGLLDPHLPLSSALVLSLPADPGKGGDNGLLQAWEVMERMRLDADLVTLSACNTALGEELGGEGLIGLTRAFQYAGARSVLASLWSVADESTAVLMGRFYGYLAHGEPSAEALRRAQVDLLCGAATRPGESAGESMPDAAHPYFWAGFQLVGDWR